MRQDSGVTIEEWQTPAAPKGHLQRWLYSCWYMTWKKSCILVAVAPLSIGTADAWTGQSGMGIGARHWELVEMVRSDTCFCSSCQWWSYVQLSLSADNGNFSKTPILIYICYLLWHRQKKKEKMLTSAAQHSNSQTSWLLPIDHYHVTINWISNRPTTHHRPLVYCFAVQRRDPSFPTITSLIIVVVALSDFLQALSSCVNYLH